MSESHELHNDGLNQSSAPYAEALLRHAEQEPLMFMVPGHAATGDGMSKDLADFIGAQALRLDIPQLVDGIDVGEDSPLMHATELAADAWGARRSWFLGNGSSQGNRQAVIAVAAVAPGGVLVAQRSAHSSLLDGLVVTGMSPEWVLPEIDRTHGINHGVTAETLAEAFARAHAAGERPSAAYVISPSYFGVVSDIPALAAVAHVNGVPLIVDAAWGAHFGFHVDLPPFPTTRGADIVVTSTHKMGGSLGQSAMLHLAEGPFADVLEPALERAHILTQTTSVSSLLLGSMDIARRSLVRGADLLGGSIQLADRLRDLVRAHPALTLVSDGFGEHEGIAGLDPLRVSIGLLGTGCTGYEMRSRLAQEHAILLEIATSSAVVAFFGPGKQLDIDRLIAAIDGVLAECQSGSDVANSVPELPGAGPRRMSPRHAYFAATEIVPFADAIGRVSADALAAYPPGIPNIAPGEEITAEAVEFLRAVAASPIGYVRGAIDLEVSRFRVVAQNYG